MNSQQSFSLLSLLSQLLAIKTLLHHEGHLAQNSCQKYFAIMHRSTKLQELLGYKLVPLVIQCPRGPPSGFSVSVCFLSLTHSCVSADADGTIFCHCGSNTRPTFPMTIYLYKNRELYNFSSQLKRVFPVIFINACSVLF